jgi:hypothetical protein
VFWEDKKLDFIAALRLTYRKQNIYLKARDRIKRDSTKLHDTMANAEEQYKLTQEQIDFFLENGWLKLSNCFTREQAEGLQENLWTRLGMDPEDKSTW